MLDIQEEETEIIYYIRHDPDAVLSFQVTTELITLRYRTRTQRFEVEDEYITVIVIFYVTNPDVQVSLSWI